MGNCAPCSAKKKPTGGEDEGNKPANLGQVVEDCGDLGDEVQLVVFPHACDVGKLDHAAMQKAPRHGYSELFTRYCLADCGPLTDAITKHFQDEVYFDSQVNDAFIVLTRIWEGALNPEGAGGYYVLKPQEESITMLLRLALERAPSDQDSKAFLVVPIGTMLYEGKLSEQRFGSQYDLSPSSVSPGEDIIFLPRETVTVASAFTDKVLEQLPETIGISSADDMGSVMMHDVEVKMKLLVVRILKTFEASAFEAAEMQFNRKWQSRINQRVNFKFPKHRVTERTLLPTQVSQLPEAIQKQLGDSDVCWTKKYVAAVTTRYFVMRYHIARRTLVRRIYKDGKKSSSKGKK